MLNNHPYGTRPVRKQSRRKVVWRTTAPAFDPSLVSRTLSPAGAR